MAAAIVAFGVVLGAQPLLRTVRESPILTFTGKERAASIDAFERVDDSIMGGVSQSGVVEGDDCATFKGVMRTDGGGFCGTRTVMRGAPLDLSSFSGLYVRCSGEPRVFKMSVRTQSSISELVFQACFAPPGCGDAGTVRLPFGAFRLVRRSEPVDDRVRLDAACVFQIGFVYSRFGFGEEDMSPNPPGPFSLQLYEVGAYWDSGDKLAFIDDVRGERLPRTSWPTLESLPPRMGANRFRFRQRAVQLARRVLRQKRKRGTFEERRSLKRASYAKKLLGLRSKGWRLSEIRSRTSLPTDDELGDRA